MSRTISEIYSEAVAERDKYIGITSLDSGRTKSKLSVLNLLTYVMAVLIHTYETILDVFEVNVGELLASRVNGNPQFYAVMAKKFQYNSDTKSGDELVFDEDTLTISYKELNTEHRIIAQSSWEDHVDETGNVDGITLKVCKDNENSTEVSEGLVYEPLESSELIAFKRFIREIKFVTAKIYPISQPGDIVTIKSCNVTYDDRYITETQVFDAIKAALISYSSQFVFNGYIYYQDIVNVIQKVDHVSMVAAGMVVEVNAYDTIAGSYKAATTVTSRALTDSGYIRFLDADGKTTIKNAAGDFSFNKLSEQ